MLRNGPFDELGIHAGQAIPVLDDTGGDSGISERATELGPSAVHSRANLGFDPDHRLASLACPLGDPRYAAIEISPPLVGGETVLRSERLVCNRQDSVW